MSLSRGGGAITISVIQRTNEAYKDENSHLHYINYNRLVGRVMFLKKGGEKQAGKSSQPCTGAVFALHLVCTI